MTTNQFTILCKVNNINTSSIVVGYVIYTIHTDKQSFDYQSFIYYDITNKTLNQYQIERSDLKKYIGNQPVIKIDTGDIVDLVDISIDRQFLWKKLEDKYIIKDIDKFLKYNGVDNKKA